MNVIIKTIETFTSAVLAMLMFVVVLKFMALLP